MLWLRREADRQGLGQGLGMPPKRSNLPEHETVAPSRPQIYALATSLSQGSPGIRGRGCQQKGANREHLQSAA